MISRKGPSGSGREEKRGGNRQDGSLKGTAEDDATMLLARTQIPCPGWNASCLQVGLELLQSSEEHLDYRVARIVTEAGALEDRARLLVRLLFRASRFCLGSVDQRGESRPLVRGFSSANSGLSVSASRRRPRLLE